MEKREPIPTQTPVSWKTAFVVSWAGVSRRMVRSVLAMSGVVLAIAFLSYMLTVDNITKALVAVGDPELNLVLQKAGVDILSSGGADKMMILLVGLSLLTCTVGIVNSMLMSVTERVKEIGTLKCLGATDTFIVKAYLIESVLQGACGSLAGMILGCLVATVIALKTYGLFTFEYFPVVSVLQVMVLSFLAGAAMSVIAAIAPAYAAAKKEPVDALRVEE